MNIQVFDDLDGLYKAAAEKIIREANESIGLRGVFRIALSGGSTPKKLYQMLSEQDADWPSWRFYFGDERFVPPTDVSSNERMARETLLDPIGAKPSQVFAMYREGPLETAAETYDKLLEDVTLDLILLGLGPDGHTASLFPNDPSLHEAHRRVVPSIGVQPVLQRLTMTPSYIVTARKIRFLIAGADKHPAYLRLIANSNDVENTPAKAVAYHAQGVELFVERQVTESTRPMP